MRGRTKSLQLCLMVIEFVLAGGCGHHVSPNTNATLWIRKSLEYRATTRSVFTAAAGSLEAALGSPTWSAILEQGCGSGESLRPAVILDIDETVLNNSAYQAQLVRQRASHSAEPWDRWVERGDASAVEGALEYVRQVKELQISLIYITNRACSMRPGERHTCPQSIDTLRNLSNLGFPDMGPTDLILLRGERPEWDDDKSSRRRHVCGEYRVLQMIGDDLADFIPGAGSASAERRGELFEEHVEKWGTQWFMLPNPTYGSWLTALSSEPIDAGG